MREKTIEAKLVQAVRTKGGLAPKFTSPGLDGVPDRLVLLPGGRIAFIELKAPGKTLRPLQVRRKRQLEALGFSVYCIDMGSVSVTGKNIDMKKVVWFVRSAELASKSVVYPKTDGTVCMTFPFHGLTRPIE